MKPQIQKKQQEVEILKEKIANAKSVICFEYQGLSVSAFTELRRELMKNDSEVKVYKNNIARRAFKEAGIEEIGELLVGPLAIAQSSIDTVAPAKVVKEFSKKNKQVVIKTGIIEGKFATLEQLEQLATLPNRETLLTMLAAGLYGPVRDLAIGLNLLAEQMENQQ